MKTEINNLESFIKLPIEVQRASKNKLLEVKYDNEGVYLYYHLTPGQRYSTHKAAANKKLHELMREGKASGTYTFERSFPYEGNDSIHNIILYSYTRS